VKYSTTAVSTTTATQLAVRDSSRTHDTTTVTATVARSSVAGPASLRRAASDRRLSKVISLLMRHLSSAIIVPLGSTI
jgi:hypothetical protein